EHADKGAVAVGDDQVGSAVAVHVGDLHRHRVGGGQVPGRLEGAVAVAQQHAHTVVPRAGVGNGVGDDHVRPAVAVDVGRRYVPRLLAGGEVLGGPEGAVAVAQ